MNNIRSILILICLSFAFTSCSKSNEPNAEKEITTIQDVIYMDAERWQSMIGSLEDQRSSRMILNAVDDEIKKLRNDREILRNEPDNSELSHREKLRYYRQSERIWNDNTDRLNLMIERRKELENLIHQLNNNEKSEAVSGN